MKHEKEINRMLVKRIHEILADKEYPDKGTYHWNKVKFNALLNLLHKTKGSSHRHYKQEGHYHHNYCIEVEETKWKETLLREILAELIQDVNSISKR